MQSIRMALLAALVGSAAIGAASDEPKLSERPARTSSRDIKIPRALVNQIEEDYRAFLTKNEVSPKSTIQRKLLNLSVLLTQKAPVALHEEVRVTTPLGGGVVDLGEFVTPLRGMFRFKIVVRGEKNAEAEPQGLQVYYVSNAKARLINGESYGAGCNKYMDITAYYNKKSDGQGHGFELYTADQRYVSVVSGTFVVFTFEKEALSVGTLSITDSRYPDLLCL